MKHSLVLALGLSGLATGTIAQGTDLTQLGIEDILKLQIVAGQTAEQLEEQLADQLTFDTEDQFEARRKVKTYVETLFAQSGMMGAPDLSATLPIREITYDFDMKTYKLCLPSSMLYSFPVEGGTAEALVSFRFGDLATKDAEACPFLKSGFTPGTTLGVSNYMEINVEMAQAEKIHEAIEAEQGRASFTCDELTYVQGRFDTGPTQLVCAADSVELSVMGGPSLRYSSGGNDSWITRSGGSADDSGSDATSDTSDDGMSLGETETAMVAPEPEPATQPEPQTIEPGTILTETALELDKSGRIAVQRRLNLLGYSTRGVDGVFGPGTRAGLTQWQIKNGMPVSGYLSGDQLGVLNATSETLYLNWLAANANATTTTTKKTTTKKRKYYRGSDGCLRTRPGNARKTIIPGQSKYCNQRRRGKR